MPRRGANIYKRKDGRWEGRIKKEDSAGDERRYISVYGKSYAEVKSKMEDIKSSIHNYEVAEKCTLGEVVNLWLGERGSYWKQTTYATYHNIASKYILPGLGNMPISCVNEEVIEKFLTGIKKDDDGNLLSNRYLRSICAVILRAMNYAKKRHHYGIEIPENLVLPAKQGEFLLPCEGDLAILEKYLLDNMEDDTCLGILIAFYTGMRIGELCALTWEDIDLKEETICVRKNLQRVRAGEDQGSITEILLQTPKTCTSFRLIPIPPVLLDLLKGQKQEGSGYVIKGRRRPWAEPRTLQYRFAKILETCQIEGFNFHMLRHAFATRCIDKGFDVKSLSEILGHSNIQITLNLYVHSNMQRKKQLMRQFDIFFYQNGSPKV